MIAADHTQITVYVTFRFFNSRISTNISVFVILQPPECCAGEARVGSGHLVLRRKISRGFGLVGQIQSNFRVIAELYGCGGNEIVDLVLAPSWFSSPSETYCFPIGRSYARLREHPDRTHVVMFIIGPSLSLITAYVCVSYRVVLFHSFRCQLIPSPVAALNASGVVPLGASAAFEGLEVSSCRGVTAGQVVFY